MKPLKSAEEPREIEIRFRVNESELDAFQSKADELGLKVSSWARMHLRRCAGLAPQAPQG